MTENIRVTELLEAWRTGDNKAGEEVMRIVFRELHKIAVLHVRKERRNGTLQPTALLNEAYIRLVGVRRPWNNRGHFFSAASKVMRQVLVDGARKREAKKRWAGEQQIPFNEEIDALMDALAPDQVWKNREILLLALDEALKKLAKIDPDQARIVELRYFGGLTVEQTAVTLQMGSATVKRDWAMARVWLEREIRLILSDTDIEPSYSLG